MGVFLLFGSVRVWMGVRGWGWGWGEGVMGFGNIIVLQKHQTDVIGT